MRMYNYNSTLGGHTSNAKSRVIILRLISFKYCDERVYCCLSIVRLSALTSQDHKFKLHRHKKAYTVA